MIERPIRILCVFSTLDRGGAESMCMNLYRHIDRSLVQFDFVKHTESQGAFEEEILGLGGRVFVAPRYRIYNILEYQNWWRRHFSSHPEHQKVHIHFFTMAGAICPVAKKFGRETITHAHTSRADSMLKQMMVRNVGKLTDVCFACSEEAGKWLFPNRTFKVLPNAIDTTIFQHDPVVREEVRKKYGLTDALVVGIVGSITAVKNPLETIAVFKELVLREPKSRLLWLGSGDMLETVKSVVNDASLSEKVILLGVRHDVYRMMQAMDVYLQPSVYEGLSVSQIEAQAAGLRCFVSDTITKEADLTGRCTYLPLGQPAMWAESILSTDLNKKDTQRQIIDAGYDIKTTSKWLQEFYLSH